jgi:hypothetical protein
MSNDHNDQAGRSSSSLELTNKKLAATQVRMINKELTELKKRTSTAEEKPQCAPMESDKTGQFVLLPLKACKNEKIEEAYKEAKEVSDSSPPAQESKKRKKWYLFS